MAHIRIGTSGWRYDHWVGPFYPEGIRPADILPYYAERFPAVEINNTFYQLPDPKTPGAWRDATPNDFRFAVKASRYITHMKKLKDPHDSVRRFFEAVEALGDKLGPVLFQLPPKWGRDLGRLEEFFEALPRGRRYAFEFRDESWLGDETYELLEKRNAALCIYDLDGRRSPARTTADFVYVRLHGPDGPYQGSYDGRTLNGWARRFRRWRDEGRDIYCFFDNDDQGYAPRDALELQRMLE